jgi:putative transposase
MMMPRSARVVFEGVVHHITQRGNYRQNIFEDSADRKKYIEFVSEYSRKYQMKIYAYCLMTNHVHFLAAPLRRDSLAMTFKYANMRYSSYFNKKNRRSGHLWQGRFYSCPLHHDHALEALRYVERNPVRAKMVRFPWEYEWSSAREHVGFIEEAGIRSEDEGNESEHRTPGLVSDRSITQSSSFHGAGKVSEKDTLTSQTLTSSSRIIKLSPLQELDLNWNPEGWREFLGFPDEEDFLIRIRGNTFSGKPLFAQELVADLEKELGVPLGSKPRGRPKKE